jgi:WD40 repeat protein
VIKQSSPGMCRIIWAVQLHTTARGHRYCVSAGATKVIHVFDWETGVERCTLRGHLEGVRCLAIASDGTMASGSNDFTVRLW